jgi:hypothetical protein
MQPLTKMYAKSIGMVIGVPFCTPPVRQLLVVCPWHVTCIKYQWHYISDMPHTCHYLRSIRFCTKALVSIVLLAKHNMAEKQRTSSFWLPPSIQWKHVKNDVHWSRERHKERKKRETSSNFVRQTRNREQKETPNVGSSIMTVIVLNSHVLISVSRVKFKILISSVVSIDH